MLLGNGKGDSRRGNIEWLRCSLDMSMLLQIQFRCKKERSLEWPERIWTSWRDGCMVFSILADVGEGKKDFVMLSESTWAHSVFQRVWKYSFSNGLQWLLGILMLWVYSNTITRILRGRTHPSCLWVGHPSRFSELIGLRGAAWLVVADRISQH